MTVAARRETTVAKNVVTIALLLLFVLSLAYANGANDVSKGVATLVGGGVTTYRRGLAWGTLRTVAGALLAPCRVSRVPVAGLLAAGVWRFMTSLG